jgi:hypothetical protein
MRCPECLKTKTPHRFEQKEVSKIAGQDVSCEHFWDDADRQHIHDHFVRTFVWSCSNHHHYRVVTMTACPVKDCDWNQKEEVKAWKRPLGT